MTSERSRASQRAGRHRTGLASLAARVVESLGGRYSVELGIDVDANEDEIERWALAATLFGARISATIAERTFAILEQAGVLAPWIPRRSKASSKRRRTAHVRFLIRTGSTKTRSAILPQRPNSFSTTATTPPSRRCARISQQVDRRTVRMATSPTPAAWWPRLTGQLDLAAASLFAIVLLESAARRSSRPFISRRVRHRAGCGLYPPVIPWPARLSCLAASRTRPAEG